MVTTYIKKHLFLEQDKWTNNMGTSYHYLRKNMASTVSIGDRAFLEIVYFFHAKSLVLFYFLRNFKNIHILPITYWSMMLKMFCVI